VVRSLQTSETASNAPAGASGVPGALTNQPPAPATAPINAPATGAAPTATATPSNTHKDSTVNYEVDKTVRYVQQPMGGLKRLSVAVVVNYKHEIDKAGKVIVRPLSEDEKTQITNLVKEAMGYSKDRGDTLNVVNSPFAGPDTVVEEVPIWKRYDLLLDWAKQGGKWLLGLIIALWVYSNFLKPMRDKLKKNLEPPHAHREGEGEDEDTVVTLSPDAEPMGNPAPSYQDNLTAAKELAKQDPKVVANIVKAWVGGANE
jgi:flagellar M-ring protein FliF